MYVCTIVDTLLRTEEIETLITKIDGHFPVFCYSSVRLPRPVLLLLFTNYSGLGVAGVAAVEEDIDGH